MAKRHTRELVWLFVQFFVLTWSVPPQLRRLSTSCVHRHYGRHINCCLRFHVQLLYPVIHNLFSSMRPFHYIRLPSSFPTLCNLKDAFQILDVLRYNVVITGPPTHSVGGQYCFALWRLSSVVVCNTMAAHMQRNLPGSSTRRRASSVTSH